MTENGTIGQVTRSAGDGRFRAVRLPNGGSFVFHRARHSAAIKARLIAIDAVAVTALIVLGLTVHW